MKYKVEQNHCNCHPETCNCNDWVIIYENGEKLITSFNKDTADFICERLNKTEENEKKGD